MNAARAFIAHANDMRNGLANEFAVFAARDCLPNDYAEETIYEVDTVFELRELAAEINAEVERDY